MASDDARYQIRLEVPGALSIEVSEDVLTIKGCKQQEDENRDQHYYRIERGTVLSSACWRFPGMRNADGIEATVENGVLTIQLPRREVPADQVRRIAIHRH